ncbi:DciA family protein [Hugenholtzia roseola]|uniref:DciA family protein n=1 Tax=Hugenholtzia roseola TaxID=1002 RepID=UPI00047BED32|nr:DUF721 domain-containing protein [Hugenholtzia roseola]
MQRNPISLNEAISQFLKAYGLDKHLEEQKIVAAWHQVLGKTVSKHTQQIALKEGTLFVKIEAPALKNNLSLMRNQIIERLNQQAECQRLKEIVFL